MTDHADLIAELEAAAEDSRELSDKVLLAWGYTVAQGKHAIIGQIGPSVYLILPDGHTIASYEDRPHPTRNLQDAIDGVPVGDLGQWSWKLAHPGYENGKLLAEYRADIHSPLSSGGGPKWLGFAATAALAMCIAILRVRSA